LPHKDPILKNQYHKLYRQTHKEQINQNRKIWLEANKDRLKEKQREACRQWRLKNPDYRKKYYESHKSRELKLSSKYRKSTPEQQMIYRKRYYDKNQVKITKEARDNYAKAIRKNRYERDRDRFTNNVKVRTTRLRSISIWHYSNGMYRCACCGYADGKTFLEIDHIDGKGNQHRQIIGTSNFHNWLVKNNLPVGFQVLCSNCNMGKWRNGGVCPHKEYKPEPIYIPPSNPIMIPHKFAYHRRQSGLPD